MSFLSNSETGSLVNRRVLFSSLPPPLVSRFCTNKAQRNRFSQDLRLVDIDLPVALAIFLFGN